MAFQRSYSKVWWGSERENSPYNNYRNGFHSLNFSENFSEIPESDESSKSWNHNDSPGSLKSQDSGFSDNDEAPNTKKSCVELEENESPILTAETSKDSRREKTASVYENQLQFPSSPISILKNYDLAGKTKRINSYEIKLKTNDKNKMDLSEEIDYSLRRKSTFIRNDSESSENSANNDTVYMNRKIVENNKLVENSKEELLSPFYDRGKIDHPNYTSTPENKFNSILNSQVTTSSKNPMCDTITPYAFDSLTSKFNNTPLSVKYWVNNLRMSYCHEVMSTLQTKSVSQEAFRNLKITTTLVAKIIRQLQTRAIVLQGEFDRTEKLLNNNETNRTMHEIISNSQELMESVCNFIKIIERRSILLTDFESFDDNIDQIKLIVKYLRISLENHHYLNRLSILEDIQVLKRHILITLQMIFERLIRIIVVNIENSKCDLMLRANLNMVATLSNVDYNGFASLNYAFTKNKTARILLLVCIDSQLSSVRALAMRALSTICSSIESIKQVCEAGGIEIIRDILSIDARNNHRTEPERREAVSFLTQITAPWHGSNHKVPELKDHVESIVESLTDIITKTDCCQTLLLCVAALNNLSRLEVTSLYSIMSNETVTKLKVVVEFHGPNISIFLCDQIVGMLQNMSNNKKCQKHLVNNHVIDLLTFIFLSKFDEKYLSRSENEAHRKTIKTILYILRRFIHESLIDNEIIVNNLIPIFKKVEKNLRDNNEYLQDISFLNQQMNENVLQKSFSATQSSSTKLHPNQNHHDYHYHAIKTNTGLKININKQESYV